jgi:NAD(P)-dependent dehydrogenase (short-subunit alcohol dehydrogenase family)
MGSAGQLLCEGRVCVITGAGRGIGREYAHLLAREGAPVVVNDVGAAVDGSGGDPGPARCVVDEIVGLGGVAVEDTSDISSWEGAKALIEHALEEFGRLDVVVNNAGILRDRMLVNMTEEEFDAVINVHLKGTFCTTRHAASYWQSRAKAGEHNDARVINTTSIAGLYGNPGQVNYASAKAAIAALTIVAAQELGRYGVTVNAIAPGAMTRMTENLGLSERIKDQLAPEWVAPVCAWLASPISAGVTGQVIEASGAVLAIAEGWHRGPTTQPVMEPSEIDNTVRKLLAETRPATSLAEIFGDS